MTDAEIVQAIRRIIKERTRKGKVQDGREQMAIDLQKFDRIVGLIKREAPSPEDVS